MSRKLFFPLIFLIGLFQSTTAWALPMTLPQKFYVSEHWISWTTSFDIETDEYKIGTVYRKFFSWSTQYEFYNYYGTLEATARMRFFSWGVVFDVCDADKTPIGQIAEKIYRFFPTFEILSPDGDILGIAQMNLWGTKYTVSHPCDHHALATLARSFFRVKDDWMVLIHDSSVFNERQIDPRLFVTLMAFQTDYDHWRAQKQECMGWFAQNEALFGENFKSNEALDLAIDRLESYTALYADLQSDESDEDFVKTYIENSDRFFENAIEDLIVILEDPQWSLSHKKVLLDLALQQLHFRKNFLELTAR